MNNKNKILNSIVYFTRKLPPYRKFNEVFNLINTVFLKLGVEPIVDAKMKDGTKMIVNISTYTERHSFYTGRYDADLLNIIKSLILPNSTF